MIQRLIPKNTVRLLGIQYDDTNYIEILNFCKWCHYQPNSETLIFCIQDVVIEIEVGDWIINTIDNEFIILSNKEVEAIFKPIGSR